VDALERILAFLKAGKELVAYSVNCYASVIGERFDFHRGFGHRLGALSVSMIHARAMRHPGHFGVLS
jgi:hypothetical protein